MSNYVNYNERTVSLKRFISFLLKKWRAILLITVCFGVFFGGIKTFNSYKAFKNYSDSSSIQQEDNSNISLDRYNNLIIQTEEYLSNSEKMKIDPYNVYTGNLLYNIDNDYKVNINSMLQDPNNYKTIILCYKNYITGGGLFNYILNNSNLNLTSQDLSEIISFSSVMDTNDVEGFSISLIASDENKCDQLLSLIEIGIKKYHPVVNDTVGEHRILMISKDKCIKFDDSLRWYQSDKYYFLQQLKSSHGGISGAIQNTVEESNPISFSKSDALKNLIIGIGLGFVLALTLILLQYLLTKKFISEDVLSEKLDIDLLGSILGNDKICGLEKVAVKLENRQLLSMDRNQQLDLIRTNAKILMNNKNSQKIMFVGTLNKENDLKLISEIFESFKKEQVEVSDYKNILLDAQAIEDAKNADGVVFIEKQNSSFWFDIRKEIDAVKKLDNKFIGFITIE